MFRRVLSLLSGVFTRKPLGRPSQVVLGIISFCILVGLYSLISHRAYKKNPNQKTIPGWTWGDRSIAQGVKKLLEPDGDEPGWLAQDCAVSAKRFALGMLFGSSLAFLVGIAMGCFSPIEALLRPPISFLASIPPTAMIVVYMVLFGLKLKMFVAVVGVGIFPSLAQSIFQSARNDVSETAINKAYTLGASKIENIWEVVIPQILPRIIDAIRLQVGPAMIFLIAVEFALGGEGIGYRLRNAPRGNYYNVIFIYLILLGVFGLLIERTMAAVRRWLCPWFEGSNS